MTQSLVFLLACACIGAATGPAIAAEVTDDADDIVLSDAQRADLVGAEQFLLESTRSSNLRLRVLGSLYAILSTPSPAPPLPVRIQDLSEQLKGSTDALVLSVMVTLCGNDRLAPEGACDHTDLARRWVAVDAQNQVAWLTLASVLRSRGDADAASEAFARGSHAPTWHEYYDEGGRVFTRAAPASLGPRARLAVSEQSLAVAGAWLLPWGPLGELSYRCKDPALRDACIRIIDTIDRDGGSLLTKRMAISLGTRAGMDPVLLAPRSDALDALTGASVSDTLRINAFAAPSEDIPALEVAFRERADLGELPWLKARLAASGLATDAAAQRYRADVAEALRRATAAAASSAQSGNPDTSGPPPTPR